MQEDAHRLEDLSLKFAVVFEHQAYWRPQDQEFWPRHRVLSDFGYSSGM
jgi:hypothetical protein